MHCAAAVSVALAFSFFRTASLKACSLDSGNTLDISAQSPCVVYSIHRLVALLLRFSVVVGGAVEPPAAQTFERARL